MPMERHSASRIPVPQHSKVRTLPAPTPSDSVLSMDQLRPSFRASDDVILRGIFLASVSASVVHDIIDEVSSPPSGQNCRVNLLGR